jgi:hypothetical protein
LSYHRQLDYTDLHAPSSQQVENSEALTITKGQVVRIDGFGIQFPTVKLGNSNVYASFGIAQSDILAGTKGTVTCIGLMRSLNTSSWIVGTSLYCSSSGNLTSVIGGPIIAVVLRQSATDGILYVVASVDLAIAGDPANWDVSGNYGTTAGPNFLGTNDFQGLVLKTNSIEAARFTTNQRFGLGTSSPGMQFEQKSHVSANATGLQQDTFYVETNANTFQTCYTINIPDPSVNSVEFEVIARKTDGTDRACFKRSMVVYCQSSSAQLQGSGWQSDFTVKSSNGFNVSYTLGTSSITFNVKSPTSDNYRWSGSIRLQSIF